MDHADEAYMYANGRALLLSNGWHHPNKAQEIDDQRLLAIFEAKCFRCMQRPEHWSEPYEQESWKNETLLRVIWSKGFKAARSLISELL